MPPPVASLPEFPVAPDHLAKTFHAFLATASHCDVDAVLFKIAMDWNVGNELWPHLSQQFRDQIAAICRDACSGTQGGLLAPLAIPGDCH